MRLFGVLCLVAGLVSAAGVPGQPQTCVAGTVGCQDRLPNILIVLADDCTFRDLGCYGGQAQTPHIDALALRGMRFTRCFQAAPMCSPTRHCLYTGLYPVRSGAYPNHTFVKDGTRSIAHYLKSSGYRVALSGKRHINPAASFPFEMSGEDNNPDMKAIDVLMGECAAASTPFCLIACSNEPHTPWNKGDASAYDADELILPPYFADTPLTRQQMTKYLAEVTYFDQQVGQCLQLLAKHDLTDSTLVMVLSEQGSSFPFGKWTCYDTGLQSACIVQWPGVVKPGTISDAMIEYVDVVPTLLDLTGAPADEDLDGGSFLPVLTGKSSAHKQFVFGQMTTRGINDGSDYFGIRSVRSAQFKYIWNFTPEVEFQNACVKSPTFQSWIEAAANGDAIAAERVRRYQNRPGEELYDVTLDPFEWNNLASDPAHAKELAALRHELVRWMDQQGDKGQETELAAKDRQGGNRRRRTEE